MVFTVRSLIFGQGFEAKLQAGGYTQKVTKIHPKGTMLMLDEIKNDRNYWLPAKLIH